MYTLPSEGEPNVICCRWFSLPFILPRNLWPVTVDELAIFSCLFLQVTVQVLFAFGRVSKQKSVTPLWTRSFWKWVLHCVYQCEPRRWQLMLYAFGMPCDVYTTVPQTYFLLTSSSVNGLNREYFCVYYLLV